MTKTRKEFAPELLEELAAEYAAWRIAGCPGTGFWDGFRSKMTKIARKHGRSYGDLWAEAHKVAEPRIIEALYPAAK